MFSADPLLLNPLSLEKKQVLLSVVVFEQRHISMICAVIDALFFAFFEYFQSQFLIQDLKSRLTVHENGISVYQNLNLGGDNFKQIKSRN